MPREVETSRREGNTAHMDAEARGFAAHPLLGTTGRAAGLAFAPRSVVGLAAAQAPFHLLALAFTAVGLASPVDAQPLWARVAMEAAFVLAALMTLGASAWIASRLASGVPVRVAEAVRGLGARLPVIGGIAVLLSLPIVVVLLLRPFQPTPPFEVEARTWLVLAGLVAVLCAWLLPALGVAALERVGVRGAFTRAWRLSRAHRWAWTRMLLVPTLWIVGFLLLLLGALVFEGLGRIAGGPAAWPVVMGGLGAVAWFVLNVALFAFGGALLHFLHDGLAKSLASSALGAPPEGAPA